MFMVVVTENNPRISGPAQLKSVLFNGQLYVCSIPGMMMALRVPQFSAL